MKKYESKNVSKLKENKPNSLMVELLNDMLTEKDIIDNLIVSLEKIRPSFVGFSIMGKEKKLFQMIFSGQYQFYFLAGETEDEEDMAEYNKCKKSLKLFNVEWNGDTFAAIFYR